MNHKIRTAIECFYVMLGLCVLYVFIMALGTIFKFSIQSLFFLILFLAVGIFTFVLIKGLKKYKFWAWVAAIIYGGYILINGIQNTFATVTIIITTPYSIEWASPFFIGYIIGMLLALILGTFVLTSLISRHIAECYIYGGEVEDDEPEQSDPITEEKEPESVQTTEKSVEE